MMILKPMNKTSFLAYNLNSLELKQKRSPIIIGDNKKYPLTARSSEGPWIRSLVMFEVTLLRH